MAKLRGGREFRMPCGCVLLTAPKVEGAGWSMCQMHAAAPRMRQAALQVVKAWENFAPASGYIAELDRIARGAAPVTGPCPRDDHRCEGPLYAGQCNACVEPRPAGKFERFTLTELEGMIKEGCQGHAEANAALAELIRRGVNAEMRKAGAL